MTTVNKAIIPREYLTDLMATDGSVEYRAVPGFDDRYRVGSDGSVWKYRGPRVTERPGWWRKRPTQNWFGYSMVRIDKRARRVHRLVLLAFVGPPPEAGMFACHHPDPDPSNNNLSNLHWGTHQDNMNDCKTQGRSMKGESHHQAKLTETQVIEIRKRCEAGQVCTQIAKSFGVQPTTIVNIKNRVIWKHLP